MVVMFVDCCVGSYSTFRTIPTYKSYGAGVFDRARTLIAVNLLSCYLMYCGRPVKIDTALYRLSTQRNLAVTPDDISRPLGPFLSSAPQTCAACRVPQTHLRRTARGTRSSYQCCAVPQVQNHHLFLQYISTYTKIRHPKYSGPQLKCSWR
jgi:hypothetical protein